MLCLHCCNPPHPEVISPHADAGHRAVLDDLGARGASSGTTQGPPRALTTPAVPIPLPRGDLRNHWGSGETIVLETSPRHSSAWGT